MENVENTLEAFRQSSKLSHPDIVLELDVHCTKDGNIVVFHDESLHRMTGDPRNIKETNHVDLPAITKVLSPDNDRRIPELREFPISAMQIDVKSGDRECISKGISCDDLPQSIKADCRIQP